MITKDLQTATRLVNTLINETISRWSSDKNGKCYMIQHTENSDDKNIEIRPTHSDVFYGIGDYIHVAEVCGCSYYVCCTMNEDGWMTPTLRIY